MERLTKKDKCKLSHGEEIVLCEHSEDDCNDSCMNIKHCKWYEKAMEKLKHYEDLEEQGRLVKLPCKVGDTIYIIAPKYCDCTDECDLYNERFRRYLKWCKKYCPNGFKGIGVLETVIQRIEIRGNDTYVMTGKDGLRDLDNIFLTKSEAEAKLKELRGGENE